MVLVTFPSFELLFLFLRRTLRSHLVCCEPHRFPRDEEYDSFFHLFKTWSSLSCFPFIKAKVRPRKAAPLAPAIGRLLTRRIWPARTSWSWRRSDSCLNNSCKTWKADSRQLLPASETARRRARSNEANLTISVLPRKGQVWPLTQFLSFFSFIKNNWFGGQFHWLLGRTLFSFSPSSNKGSQNCFVSCYRTRKHTFYYDPWLYKANRIELS